MSLMARITVEELVTDALGDNPLRAEVAWSFINSDSFDPLCDSAGVDSNIVRQLVRKTREERRA